MNTMQNYSAPTNQNIDPRGVNMDGIEPGYAGASWRYMFRYMFLRNREANAAGSRYDSFFVSKDGTFYAENHEQSFVDWVMEVAPGFDLEKVFTGDELGLVCWMTIRYGCKLAEAETPEPYRGTGVKVGMKIHRRNERENNEFTRTKFSLHILNSGDLKVVDANGAMQAMGINAWEVLGKFFEEHLHCGGPKA